jgi:hypothetical protein
MSRRRRHAQSIQEAHVGGSSSRAISLNLDNTSHADIADGIEDKTAFGEIDGEYNAIHLVALEQTEFIHELFGIADDDNCIHWSNVDGNSGISGLLPYVGPRAIAARKKYHGNTKPQVRSIPTFTQTT